MSASVTRTRPWLSGSRQTDRFSFNKRSSMLPAMPADSDRALMLQYQAGDGAAFDQLYEKHKGSVYRYFLRYGQDSNWAEELYQEVWIKIIRARDSYQPTAKFTTYLFQLAHNCLVDHVRKQSRRPRLVVNDDLEQEPHAGQSAEDRFFSQQTNQLFLNALAQLPPEQKEAFLLREEADLGLDDIAAVTGVGRETVKSRLRYANGKLKELLSQELRTQS